MGVIRDLYLARMGVVSPAKSAADVIRRQALASSVPGSRGLVRSTAPLSLSDALGYPLRKLIQYGKLTQNGTPSQADPVDIVCNNGTLTAVDDELPAGYKRVLGFTCNNNAMWEITDFHLMGSDTVRISFSVTAACNVFGCYQGTDATDNYDLYVSTTANSKYLRYGNGTYLSYWSAANLGKRFDVVYSPTGTQGMPDDSTWTERDFTSENDMLIGSTTTTGTSSKLKGDLYGNIEVDGRLKLIPCERLSDNVLGYYDTYSATFYEPATGFTGAVSLGYDTSHDTVVGVIGTPEVVTVSAIGATDQTASVVDLFKVAGSEDSHDIISGVVEHETQACVYDGTQAIGDNYMSTTGGKDVGAIIVSTIPGNTANAFWENGYHDHSNNGLHFEYDNETEKYKCNGVNEKTNSNWYVYTIGSQYYDFPELKPGETWYFSHNVPYGMYARLRYKSTDNTQNWLCPRDNGDGTFRTVEFVVPDDYASFVLLARGIRGGDLGEVEIHADDIVYSLSKTPLTEWVPFHSPGTFPIVEHVSPQPITLTEGDNTVSVTAEVSSISLEALYKKERQSGGAKGKSAEYWGDPVAEEEDPAEGKQTDEKKVSSK